MTYFCSAHLLASGLGLSRQTWMQPREIGLEETSMGIWIFGLNPWLAALSFIFRKLFGNVKHGRVISDYGRRTLGDPQRLFASIIRDWWTILGWSFPCTWTLNFGMHCTVGLRSFSTIDFKEDAHRCRYVLATVSCDNLIVVMFHHSHLRYVIRLSTEEKNRSVCNKVWRYFARCRQQLACKASAMVNWRCISRRGFRFK